jgi:hypothetical protein
MGAWSIIKNVMINQISNLLIGVPVVISKFSVFGFLAGYKNELGNCITGFSCDPNHLPGYTYDPARIGWGEQSEPPTSSPSPLL